MEEKDVRQMNPISLAFLGDAVYSLFVREMLVSAHDCKSGALHRMASSYERAGAQARAFDALESSLSDDERELARRARNCHNNNKAKNAELAEYKKATALEAVIGYLKLIGNEERVNEIIKNSIFVIDGGEQ